MTLLLIQSIIYPTETRSANSVRYTIGIHVGWMLQADPAIRDYALPAIILVERYSLSRTHIRSS